MKQMASPSLHGLGDRLRSGVARACGAGVTPLRFVTHYEPYPACITAWNAGILPADCAGRRAATPQAALPPEI